MEKRKSGIVLTDSLRILFRPVDSSGTNSHNDEWATRTSHRNPRLLSIGAGLFWWLMSVILGLLISRLH